MNQLEQRVLQDESRQIQSLHDLNQIKQTAQIIQQNIEQINLRVSQMESNSQLQIDSSTRNVLTEHLETRLQTLTSDMQLKTQELKSLQNQIQSITEQNLQSQISRLGEIINRNYLERGNQVIIPNSRIVQSANQQEGGLIHPPDNLFEEEKDIYVDRVPSSNNPHTVSPIRIQGPSNAQVDRVNQQLEISGERVGNPEVGDAGNNEEESAEQEAEQLFNSISEIPSSNPIPESASQEIIQMSEN